MPSWRNVRPQTTPHGRSERRARAERAWRARQRTERAAARPDRGTPLRPYSSLAVLRTVRPTAGASANRTDLGIGGDSTVTP